MLNASSFLDPFGLVMACLGTLSLIAAVNVLFHDLTKIQEKTQKRPFIADFRYPELRRDLGWIGSSLLLLLLVVAYWQVSSYPRPIAYLIAAALPGFAGAMLLFAEIWGLVADLRKEQEKIEGKFSLPPWYRRYAVVQKIRQIFLYLAFILGSAIAEYEMVRLHIDTSLSWNIEPELFFLSGFFFAFFLLFVYAGILDWRSKQSC
jgi:MFS family permease